MESIKGDKEKKIKKRKRKKKERKENERKETLPISEINHVERRR